MKIYRAIKFATKNFPEVSFEWTDKLGDETHWQSDFGLPERWKNEKECTKEEIDTSINGEKRDGEFYYKLPAEYEVKIEDYEIPVEQKIKTETSLIAPSEFMIAYLEKENGNDGPMKKLSEKYFEIKKKHEGEK